MARTKTAPVPLLHMFIQAEQERTQEIVARIEGLRVNDPQAYVRYFWERGSTDVKPWVWFGRYDMARASGLPLLTIPGFQAYLVQTRRLIDTGQKPDIPDPERMKSQWAVAEGVRQRTIAAQGRKKAGTRIVGGLATAQKTDEKSVVDNGEKTAGKDAVATTPKRKRTRVAPRVRSSSRQKDPHASRASTHWELTSSIKRPTKRQRASFVVNEDHEGCPRNVGSEPAQKYLKTGDRNKRDCDHYIPEPDKLGARIKGYLNSRNEHLEKKWAAQLAKGIFDDGRFLYLNNTTDLKDGYTRERIDHAITSGNNHFGEKACKFIDKDMYTVAKYQFWVAAAICTEHNLRYLQRTSDPARRRELTKAKKDNGSVTHKKEIEKYGGLSFNKAMVQRFFSADASKMSKTWVLWEDMWGLPKMFEDEDKKLVVNPAFVAMFPEDERQRLYNEAIAWEEGDESCKKDPHKWFFEREVADEEVPVQAVERAIEQAEEQEVQQEQDPERGCAQLLKGESEQKDEQEVSTDFLGIMI